MTIHLIAEAGGVTTATADQGAFARGLAEVSENTRTSYQTDLQTWAAYLASAGVDRADCDFYHDPDCWAGVADRLVKGFKAWLLGRGFAIATVNRKLSCVRRFCKWATAAGVIPGEELVKIQDVHSITPGNGLELDKKRSPKRIERPGAKKEQAILLDEKQARQLKRQPASPQGRRDALLMCLLLDHGLRAGEVAGLTLANFNLKQGSLTFWRKNVQKEQTHQLSADTLCALRTYVAAGDAPALGPILRASRKNGQLVDEGGMTRVAISIRVRTLGETIGVQGLSAHDCRHTWATHAVDQGTAPVALKEAGGWSTITTISRYFETAKLANGDVKLPY